MDTDYIGSLRKIVGHKPIILTFAGGVLVNENNEILLQKRVEFEGWGYKILFSLSSILLENIEDTREFLLI